MAIQEQIALAVLQLVALAIPPVAVLIKMLRHSENLGWTFRKLSFGMAILSVVFFILSGMAVLGYFYTAYVLEPLIKVALATTVAGLIPFALFTGVLYKEHREEFGP
jgi:hypothetical protein